MAKKVMAPVHPGELLREELLEPMGITAYQLAKDLGVPAPRVYDIVTEKRGISPDTALRLSRYFGMSEGYWINAQAHYDLEVAKDQGGDRIEREIRPRAGVIVTTAAIIASHARMEPDRANRWTMMILMGMLTTAGGFRPPAAEEVKHGISGRTASGERRRGRR